MPVACPNCTYDLASQHWASNHVRCPECGFEWTAEELEAHARRQPYSRSLASMVAPTVLIALVALCAGSLGSIARDLRSIGLLALLVGTVVGLAAPFVIAARRSHPAELRRMRFADESMTGLVVNVGVLALAYLVFFTMR